MINKFAVTLTQGQEEEIAWLKTNKIFSFSKSSKLITFDQGLRVLLSRLVMFVCFGLTLRRSRCVTHAVPIPQGKTIRPHTSDLIPQYILHFWVGGSFSNTLQYEFHTSKMILMENIE